MILTWLWKNSAFDKFYRLQKYMGLHKGSMGHCTALGFPNAIGIWGTFRMFLVFWGSLPTRKTSSSPQPFTGTHSKDPLLQNSNSHPWPMYWFSTQKERIIYKPSFQMFTVMYFWACLVYLSLAQWCTRLNIFSVAVTIKATI